MFGKRRKQFEVETNALPEAPVAPAAAPAARPPAVTAPPGSPAPPRCVNTILQGTTIGGSIASASDLAVGGVVDGNVDCGAHLIIEATGTVHGDISARDARIDGAVEGDIVVLGRLAIGPSGCVRGNVTARAVAIEEGATLSGTCSMGLNPKKANAEVPETLFLSRLMDDDDERPFVPAMIAVPA